jgi:bisphosphoglycerate-independent phosphoglycerate mutase (AlkP superfamily)
MSKICTIKIIFCNANHYDETYQNIKVGLQKDNITEPRGLRKKHYGAKSVLLETEKYPHVTFFLSGEENCLLL